MSSTDSTAKPSVDATVNAVDASADASADRSVDAPVAAALTDAAAAKDPAAPIDSKESLLAAMGGAADASLAPANAEAEVAMAAPRALEIAPGVPRLLAPMLTAKRPPEPTVGSPSAAFLLVVAGVSLFLDLGTKLWAEKNLEAYPGYIDVVEGHLSFILAKNRGGAWGLLQSQSENLRRPFFLLVSVAAIMFIVTLYKRLNPRQHALRWGLPLVLGGALGNVVDRVRYGHVIDFIDYHADWVRTMNEFVKKYVKDHLVTDHWPTFNIADVAICIGVGLMAIDMFTARKNERAANRPAASPAAIELDAASPEVGSLAGSLEAAPQAAAGSSDLTPRAES